MRWSERLGRLMGHLLNVADVPERCDFYMGGIVTNGSLKLAISTDGKAPILAKRMREWLEDVLPEDVESNLEEPSTAPRIERRFRPKAGHPARPHKALPGPKSVLTVKGQVQAPHSGRSCALPSARPASRSRHAGWRPNGPPRPCLRQRDQTRCAPRPGAAPLLGWRRHGPAPRCSVGLCLVVFCRVLGDRWRPVTM